MNFELWILNCTWIILIRDRRLWFSPIRSAGCGIVDSHSRQVRRIWDTAVHSVGRACRIPCRYNWWVVCYSTVLLWAQKVSKITVECEFFSHNWIFFSWEIIVGFALSDEQRSVILYSVKISPHCEECLDTLANPVGKPIISPRLFRYIFDSVYLFEIWWWRVRVQVKSTRMDFLFIVSLSWLFHSTIYIIHRDILRNIFSVLVISAVARRRNRLYENRAQSSLVLVLFLLLERLCQKILWAIYFLSFLLCVRLSDKSSQFSLSQGSLWASSLAHSLLHLM